MSRKTKVKGQRYLLEEAALLILPTQRLLFISILTRNLLTKIICKVWWQQTALSLLFAPKSLEHPDSDDKDGRCFAAN